MGSNITKIQFIRNKLMSHFPIIYLLSKPNKQTFDNIKGYNTIKKYDLFDKNYYLNKIEKDFKERIKNKIKRLEEEKQFNQRRRKKFIY